MRIRIQQCNPVIGDLEGNLALIQDAYQAAANDGVDLLLLPELVVTGYPPKDLLDSASFCQQVFSANLEVASQTVPGTGVLFGSITPHSGRGRRLRNSALFAEGGAVRQVFHKSLLPTYDVFDEDRYFQPGDEPCVLSWGGFSFGVLICEDLFFNANEPPAPTYLVDPAERCRRYGAEAFLVLSASPFTAAKHEVRLEILSERARALSSPFLFSNQVGANTELVFDGDSMAVGADGEPLAAPAPFRQGFCDVELTKGVEAPPKLRGLELPQTASATGGYTACREERHFEAIRLGIADFFTKTGATGNALVGLSGGVDSALVSVLAAAALGPDRVTVIGMPTRYSSPGSIHDSEALAQRLGVEWREVSIEGLFNHVTETLDPLLASNGDGRMGVTEENLQPRLRALLLMAYSNRYGHLLLSTSNKSEISVGYSTLYGDMSGALTPIGDLYKGDVYALCRWLNEKGPFPGAIPEDILRKEPSAELRPGQRDTDSLPPYEQLDAILIRYIDRQASAQTIARETGIGVDTVVDILNKVDAAEFKRWQSPPILKLSSKAYGPGRRWPVVKRIHHR